MAIRAAARITLALDGEAERQTRICSHKLHLIRLIENKVRDPFLYSDSCYGSHDIIQAFQMLHIDRGIYADSFLQQLLNILITLGVAAAGRIRMGKLIH